MRLPSHLDKVDRLAELVGDLDPAEHFEVWYWATLTAGTNAYNACLHLAGITRQESKYSTFPGVFVVPQPDGSYRRELGEPGDVSHVGWPAIPGPLPEDIVEMEQALHRVEEHRDPCLRGTRRPTPEIIAAVEADFARVLSILRARRAEPVRDTDPARPHERATVTATGG